MDILRESDKQWEATHGTITQVISHTIGQGLMS